jgi:hypothetical protein
MHSFLWSGKYRDGKSRGVRVEAENAQDARKILEGRGWTGLELVKSEITDVVLKRQRAESGRAIVMTPDQELARARGKRPSFAGKWLKSLAGTSITLVLFGWILWHGINTHRTESAVVGGVGLVATVLLFPALTLFYGQTKRNYARLNRAKVYARWDEVLECVEKLKRSQAMTRVGVGEVELTRNRAQALAGLGRMEEALAEMKKIEDSSATPHWLYLSHLSGIYAAGRQFDQALECQVQSTSERPQMPEAWIDLAGTLARRANRPADAREALERAKKIEITPLAKPHLSSNEGAILWREGKLPEAKSKLEQALVEFIPFAQKPLVERSILSTKSYLCAVNRAIGNNAEADKQFKEVQKYLEAHKEEELLQACRGGVGRT